MVRCHRYLLLCVLVMRNSIWCCKDGGKGPTNLGLDSSCQTLVRLFQSTSVELTSVGNDGDLPYFVNGSRRVVIIGVFWPTGSRVQKGSIELWSDEEITVWDEFFEFLRSKLSERKNLISLLHHNYVWAKLFWQASSWTSGHELAALGSAHWPGANQLWLEGWVT